VVTDDQRPICRGCGAAELALTVDLGEQPASDDFPALDAPGPDRRWPLGLWFCRRCALVQLGPGQPLLEEPVRAVESETSRRHAAQVVAELLTEHPELTGCSVREFASHHGGSWLGALQQHGCRPVPETGPESGPADLVVDTHALAHEPGIGAAMNQLAAALNPGGLLVLEHHHLLPLVAECQFDTIRHGHWSYLSLTALDRLAPRYGLQVLRVKAQPVFGGSLRVTLGRAGAGHPVHPSVGELLAAERAAGLADGSGLQALSARAETSATALRAYLCEQRQAGRRVLGYGAPSKAAILLGVSGIGPDLLEFTVDASPAKHGLAIPGGRIPIRSVAELRAQRPPVVLILTWDIAEEVVSQLESDGGWGAEYMLPIPTLHRLVPAGVAG
jgi:hypothetical protein